MHLRAAAIFLFCLSGVLAPAPVRAATTASEAKALQAAAGDQTAFTLPPDKLEKAVANDRAGLIIDLGEGLGSIVALILILALGLAARMRDLAVRISKNRWLQGFAFVLQFLLLLTLLDLPFLLFGRFTDLRYGLSVQSWSGFIGDHLKGLLIIYIFSSLLVMLLFWVIRKAPRTWWFWFWLPAMAVTLFTISIKPYLIDPLFDTFEPLSQSNPLLVGELEKVVARGHIEIPPERIYLMKASDKVTTLNAYVTGIGASKRIVVWDTSIAHGTPDEIAFIFGHEMGHYVLGHIVKAMLFAFFLMLFEFWIAYQGLQFLLRRYGTAWRIPSQDDWAALVVLGLLVSTIGFFVQPIENSFSRGIEHDADVYGQEAIHGIAKDPQASARDAFRLLGELALREPHPNPLVELWYYNHPPIGRRAAFAAHYDPWAADEEPKYFAK